MKKLPVKLAKKPFFYHEAVETGLNKYDLNQLMQNGEIERVAHGLYAPVDYDSTQQEAQYRLASQRCGEPSAICLLSALDYYQLTEEIPSKVWVLVPDEKRVQSNELRLIRSRQPNWNVGIEKKSGYWVTSIERTLIECVRYKHVVGTQVAITAIKQALQKKKVKLGALYEMAKKMKLEKKIQPYIEALTL